MVMVWLMLVFAFRDMVTSGVLAVGPLAMNDVLGAKVLNVLLTKRLTLGVWVVSYVAVGVVDLSEGLQLRVDRTLRTATGPFCWTT